MQEFIFCDCLASIKQQSVVVWSQVDIRDLWCYTFLDFFFNTLNNTFKEFT